MRKLRRDESWVIYQTVNKGVVSAQNSVCARDEWEALEKLRPGAQCLVRQGIASEGVAERLARGKAGDPIARGSKMR